jgi:hypothetical protein
MSSEDGICRGLESSWQSARLQPSIVLSALL